MMSECSSEIACLYQEKGDVVSLNETAKRWDCVKVVWLDKVQNNCLDVKTPNAENSKGSRHMVGRF